MSAVRKLEAIATPRKQVKKRTKLRTKPRAKLQMHQLPFVGRDHVKPDHGGFSFWDVPLTGGYFGGNETGSAIGNMFLVHLRQSKNADNSCALHLAGILNSLRERVPTTKEEADTLKGQAVGFGSVIGQWLMAAVEHLGHNLDKVDHDKLLYAANAGLDSAGAINRLDKLCENAGFFDGSGQG